MKWLIKQYASPWLYKRETSSDAFEKLLSEISSADITSAAAADLFTYHGEDGIIQFIIRNLNNVPPVFADLGAGDCIKSNCSALALHNKWKGTFIDANNQTLAIGRRFYKKVMKQDAQRVTFQQAYVIPENVNGLLSRAGVSGDVGLLSIDIDGNDYWIWKAITEIRPKIVVIEAKVEFGLKNVVVPYSRSNHHSFNRMYNGASVEALRQLGNEKGYTLIGANPQGYNLFFIQSEDVKPPFTEIKTISILQHPETQSSFYPDDFFNKHQFVKP